MTHPLGREIEVEPARTVLLFVDVQNYNCIPDGGEYAQLSAAEREQPPVTVHAGSRGIEMVSSKNPYLVPYPSQGVLVRSPCSTSTGGCRWWVACS